MARSRVWVNVYEVERVYGGPEEGGWWYDMPTKLENGRRVNSKRAESLRNKLEALWQDNGYRYSARPVADDFTVVIEHGKGYDNKHAFVMHYE